MGNQHIPVKIHDFSLAFQQMCSMVAIGQTKNQGETLRELILQTLVLLPEEKISNEGKLAEVINSLFGLQIADHEIKFAVEQLTTEKAMQLSDSGVFILDTELSSTLKSAIDVSLDLENRVRTTWLDEINNQCPDLPFAESWNALRNYLAGAFLRHGIQAVALIDSSIELDHVYSQSLSELLKEAVKNLPAELRLDAKNAIANFVATAGQFPDRAKYIAQLADGAFNYFSLATDPKTADDFTKNISPLLLFLDTNFLFGILGLTVNPQVAVSEELIRAIQQNKFPFSLKRHARTQHELLRTVQKYEEELSHKPWSKSVSRAALSVRSLSGVEIKYHQAFVETGIDVESFFRPFRHADVLLNERNIEIYDAETDDQSEESIATLITEYNEFLRARHRDKPDKTIDHDMTLLGVVRQLRSASKSTLDAAALMITCDYSLYAFDWESSRRHDLRPCTVLPNLLWQILRPFIPADANFSQAFAQTFAIPEFRTIGSGAAEACSKMINIMASYKDFPEATARRMLSNDVLIEQLRKAESDAAFQSYVEAAIVNENTQLQGENALLSKRVEIEHKEKEDITKKLEQSHELARENEERYKFEKKERLKAEEAASGARAEKRTSEEMVSRERDKRLNAEQKLQRAYTALAIILGVIFVVIFEWLTYNIPWTWLTVHPNSYGLQGSIDLLILSIFLFIFIPKWRKQVLLPLGISILGILLTLLGGPK